MLTQKYADSIRLLGNTTRGCVHSNFSFPILSLFNCALVPWNITKFYITWFRDAQNHSFHVKFTWFHVNSFRDHVKFVIIVHFTWNSRDVISRDEALHIIFGFLVKKIWVKFWGAKLRFKTCCETVCESAARLSVFFTSLLQTSIEPQKFHPRIFEPIFNQSK